jgi:uncharacterized protein
MTGPRKKIRPAAWLLATLAALLPALPAAGEIAVPFLSGRVVDEAEMLSPNTEQFLDAELAKLEQETGAQVAVLTVPSLDDEPIEVYALRVVEAWKLGREKQDDGALLLISRDDRKMRIEVGYGLEGALPDVIAKRILSERLGPRFKAGDFDGGVAEAVATIGGIVRGEAGVLQPEAPTRQGGMGMGVWLIIAFVAFNMLLPIISAAARSKVFGWAIYPLVGVPAYLLPATLVAPAVGVLTLVAWLVIFPLLRAFPNLLPQPGTGSAGGTGGGWYGGSGGGGWSSGGGGGGFSGGGGSFGGGGASDSW